MVKLNANVRRHSALGALAWYRNAFKNPSVKEFFDAMPLDAALALLGPCRLSQKRSIFFIETICEHRTREVTRSLLRGLSVALGFLAEFPSTGERRRNFVTFCFWIHFHLLAEQDPPSPAVPVEVEAGILHVHCACALSMAVIGTLEGMPQSAMDTSTTRFVHVPVLTGSDLVEETTPPDVARTVDRLRRLLAAEDGSPIAVEPSE
uniref:Uncharacterized protein n=1 Tax=Neobodo designis TaxID=312471 RepID=A0A7S1MAI5_NEODS